MDLRRMLVLAGLALLADRTAAEGTSGGPQREPPSVGSQSWTQRDARKARDLGEKGVNATKRGASAVGKKLNEGGQAATAKVVGTRTLTGRIAGVSPGRVSVRGSDGTEKQLRLTDSTRVTVGGRKAAAGAIHEGDQVRAAYYQSGGSATAMKLEVQRTPRDRGRAAGRSGASP